MNLNKYLVDAGIVCSWDSQNQRVADNLNRIYHALDLRIHSILIMGKEGQWNPSLYDEIMSHVKDDWMSKKDMLPHLTDEQIEEYVASRAAIYDIPPVTPPW